MKKYTLLLELIIIFISAVFLLERVSLGETEIKEYNVGILTTRDYDYCIEQWSDTALYLMSKIEGASFKVIPLSYKDIESAIKNEKVDFLFLNSALYVNFEMKYGIERIATLRDKNNYVVYGSAILTKKDNLSINNLRDLRGKKIAGVDGFSLGGWIAALRELKANGIDPYKECSSIEFLGAHDKCVYAVKDGKVDAGIVKTGTLEQMAKEGKVNIDDFKVIHDHVGMHTEVFKDFKFLHSTRIYPEWPFAKAKNTGRKIAERVSIALMETEPDYLASVSGNYSGWTVPLAYTPVHECLRELKLPPYEDYGKVTLKKIITQYYALIIILFIFLLAMLVTTIQVLKLNIKLAHSETGLKKQISERKIIEEDLKKSQKATLSMMEDLQKAYDELKKTQGYLIEAEKMQGIGRMASGVAHEVKNPLGIILQGMNFLESRIPQSDTEICKTLAIIKDNIKRADNIISSLVDFSKERKLELKEEDINFILEESLDLVKYRLNINDIKISKELQSDLPKVIADRGKLEQVYINLLLNAIQAMQQGGSLFIRSYIISLDAISQSTEKMLSDNFHLNEKAIVTEIEDTGAGIDNENINKIFEPFFTTKGPKAGTGLGLAVAKNILDMHRYNIHVESVLGKGTKIKVYLKIA